MNNKALASLRKRIDKEDEKIIRSLAKRQETVRKIGKVKKEMAIPILDNGRWEKVVKSRQDMAKKLNLSEGLVINIYKQIHKNSLEIEKGVKNENSK